MRREWVEAWAEIWARKRILVVGDLMLDRFIWGSVSRISPEAPVPVVRVERESAFPGGAANVARNLLPFVGEVRVVGIAGTGPQGDALLHCYREHGIDTGGVVQHSDFETIVKTRVVARAQQVVRIDRERVQKVEGEAAAEVLRRVEATLEGVDALIIEDYGKGLVTQELMDGVLALAAERGVPVTVDPNPASGLIWKGVLAIKPNRHEAFHVAGLPEQSLEPDPARHPLTGELERRLRERWDCAHLLVTLGEEGMLLLEKGAAPFHAPSRAQEVFDVSGAGDTAIALFTLALLGGASPREAAEAANYASGVVIGKIGTATLTLGELLDSVPAMGSAG